MSTRILITVLLALGLGLAIQAWNTHLVAKGDAQGAQRVRTEWKTASAKQTAAAAQASADAERQEREEEQTKQVEAERIAREQAQRETALRAAVGRADARNRSLLDTIAELNARAAVRVPEAGANTCPATCTDEATTARQLLRQCSSAYAAVAADADWLAAQVTGLQDYVRVMRQNTGEQDTNGL